MEKKLLPIQFYYILIPMIVLGLRLNKKKNPIVVAN